MALFRIWRGEPGVSTWTDLYLVNNHQSAGPDNRVRQRTEQATYNARIAEAILAAEPAGRVLVGGDLNTFPRPDDPYPPGAPIPGVGQGPSDQLRALYDSPLTNLYGTLLGQYPASTYTFGFQGQAQTLDHLWVSPSLHDDLVDVRSAKINVDWPMDARGEQPAYGRFGVSDHDPEAARFDATASFETVRALLDRLTAGGELPSQAGVPLRALLDTGERLLERGQPQPADAVLATAAELLPRLRQVGLVSPEVAAGVSAEIQQLRP